MKVASTAPRQGVQVDYSRGGLYVMGGWFVVGVVTYFCKIRCLLVKYPDVEAALNQGNRETSVTFAGS